MPRTLSGGFDPLPRTVPRSDGKARGYPRPSGADSAPEVETQESPT